MEVSFSIPYEHEPQQRGRRVQSNCIYLADGVFDYACTIVKSNSRNTIVLSRLSQRLCRTS
jgi:hypothetical protein